MAAEKTAIEWQNLMRTAEPVAEPKLRSIPGFVDCMRRTVAFCRQRPKRGPITVHGPPFLVYGIHGCGDYVPDEYHPILLDQMMDPPDDAQREHFGRRHMWYAIARTQERSTRERAPATPEDGYLQWSKFTDSAKLYSAFIWASAADDRCFLADQGLTEEAALAMDDTGHWNPMNLAALPYKTECDKGLTGWTHN